MPSNAMTEIDNVIRLFFVEPCDCRGSRGEFENPSEDRLSLKKMYCYLVSRSWLNTKLKLSCYSWERSLTMSPDFHKTVKYTDFRNFERQNTREIANGYGVGVAIVAEGISFFDNNFSYLSSIQEIRSFKRNSDKSDAVYEKGKNYPAPVTQTDSASLGTLAAELIAGRKFGFAEKSNIYGYTLGTVYPDLMERVFHEIAERSEIHVVCLARYLPGAENTDDCIDPQLYNALSQMINRGKVLVMPAGSAKGVGLRERFYYCGFPARCCIGLTVGSASSNSSKQFVAENSLYYPSKRSSTFKPDLYASGQKGLPRILQGITKDDTVVSASIVSSAIAIGIQDFKKPRNWEEVEQIKEKLKSVGDPVLETGYDGTHSVRFLNVEDFMKQMKVSSP